MSVLHSILKLFLFYVIYSIACIVAICVRICYCIMMIRIYLHIKESYEIKMLATVRNGNKVHIFY